MSGELRSFDFSGCSIRVTLDDQGEPWFVAADACRVLGIVNGRQVTSSFPDDEKGVCSAYTPGGNQQVTTLSEPGLYRLIFGSRRPEAESFRRWVIHEVLPSIRKTGAYAVQDLIPKTLPEALRAYAAALEDKAALTSKVQELTPKAEFSDAITDSRDGMSIQAAAKMLGTGQNRLFRLLYVEKVLMPENRLPYQEFEDRGYFRVIAQTPWQDKEGNTHIPRKTLVTGKGLAWIQKKWFPKQEGAA